MLLDLAQQHEEQGRWHDAIMAAERLLELHPLSEEAHRRLMRLNLNDDRPAALKAYARCRALLRQELQLDPLPETVQLALDIERQEVLVQIPASPPTLPLAVRRPPRLVGRQGAWQQLQAAWTEGQFIVVSGEPGVGKTRLLQDFVAHQGKALRVVAHPATRWCRIPPRPAVCVRSWPTTRSWN